jgi:3-oxoacyl-[acyl-carrier-protein] synthase II
MVLRRVVVTGLGALTPIGNIEEYWNSLINGVSGAAPITYFDASNLKLNLHANLKTLMLKIF